MVVLLSNEVSIYMLNIEICPLKALLQANNVLMDL